MSDQSHGLPNMSVEPRRRGLGRGLEALLGKPALDEALIRELRIEEIRPGRFQPRSEITDDDLGELVASIQARGVLQPVIVRPAEGGYELVAGERRVRAALEAGVRVIPAIVRHLSDQESLEIALLENLQRKDLTPLDRARAYQRLQEEFGLTQEQMAGRLQKSQSSVANTLRLLQLPAEAQESLQRGRITEGHARALLAIAARQEQLEALRQIEHRGLSVRQSERLAKARSRTRRTPISGVDLGDPNLKALEHDLSDRFQTKVSIRPGRRGEIVIEFYSSTDLDRLVDLLLPSRQVGEVLRSTPA